METLSTSSSPHMSLSLFQGRGKAQAELTHPGIVKKWHHQYMLSKPDRGKHGNLPCSSLLCPPLLSKEALQRRFFWPVLQRAGESTRPENPICQPPDQQ